MDEPSETIRDELLDQIYVWVDYISIPQRLYVPPLHLCTLLTVWRIAL